MGEPPASARAIVSVLNAYRPEVLEGLKDAFPDARAHLAVGGEVMGPDGSTQALKAAALALLDNVSAIADSSAAATDRKLKIARRIDLGGSLVGLSSTAGLVSVLTQLVDWISPLPLAIISFLGGSVPVVSGWIRTGSDGASISQILTSMHDTVWQARVLRGRIDRGEPVPDLVNACNEIAATLAKQLTALGCPDAVRPL